MQRTDFSDMFCPIARGLGRVGEWWSMLIMREAMYGASRFDEFEKNLKIAPSMLTRRLSDLVEAGLLEKRQYCERPPRFEYVMTPAGVAFQPVLLALAKWGNEYFSPDGATVQMVDRASGATIDPLLVDAATGAPLTHQNVAFVPGPAASVGVVRRLQAASARQEVVQA